MCPNKIKTVFVKTVFVKKVLKEKDIGKKSINSKNYDLFPKKTNNKKMTDKINKKNVRNFGAGNNFSDSKHL